MAFADDQSQGTIKEAALTPQITLAGTVTRGDILGYSSGWKRALATAGSVVQGRLVALQDGVSGDVIRAAQFAVVTGRYSGATPGNAIYVAEGSDNGKVTETAPSTTNDANTIIGRAIDATTLLLYPGIKPDSTA